jgi:hypothetical protein
MSRTVHATSVSGDHGALARRRSWWAVVTPLDARREPDLVAVFHRVGVVGRGHRPVAGSPDDSLHRACTARLGQWCK